MSGNSFYPSPCTHFPFPVFVCLTSIWVFYIHTHVILLYFKQIYDNEHYCFFFSSSSSSSSVCLTFFFFSFYYMEMGNGEYVAFKCIITLLFSMCNTRTSNRLYTLVRFAIFLQKKKLK